MSTEQVRIAALITSLQRTPPPGVNVEALVAALEDLGKMCGIPIIKNSIVDHIQLLIVEGGLSPEQLVHGLITGRSGTGKTTVSTIIARIWHAMGLLKRQTAKTTPEAAHINAATVLSTRVHSAVNSLRKRHAPNVPISEMNASQSIEWDSAVAMCASLTRHLTNGATAEAEAQVNTPYVIAGRETFIGPYQGHTTKKTLDFLSKNVGKVIIVEEAYSLCMGHHDTFGSELLMLINRHMTEKPDDNSFIFCGYPDMIAKNLFAAQPGLARRFFWRFQMDEYSGRDLGNIFTRQVLSSGKWSLAVEPEKLALFFEQKREHFPDSGGDTLRLALACRLAASAVITENGDAARQIDISLVEAGFARLKPASQH